ncbi:MAG TPA: nitroreductase family protein [Candidatus Acidoferrales bacterium]
MENPAPADHPIHELLKRRWSPRAFDARPVEEEKLRQLFEAARWAPSSFNDQPWRFIVTRRGEPAHQKLVDCLVPGNAVWAAAAPVLALSVASLNFSRNAKPNRHAAHDVGMAVANLLVQATSLGLFVHQMAGFDAEKARAAFDIPADHDPVAAMTIGYAGDPASLPEKLRAGESALRTRKPLPEMVFGGDWGAPAPWLK